MLTENDNQSPRICVIGAGPSGLACAKNLIAQGLTRFDVFEKNSRIGGNWVYDETNQHSSVYETTHLISSKRMSQYEDFPMPWLCPDYPSHRDVLVYLEDYAAHFGVMPYVRFESCVEKVEPLAEGRWQVTWRDASGVHAEQYDYVMVANGHHWDPLTPEYPGAFSGELLHAHDYKRSDPFRNKRVLVVGGGNSGCDIAAEVSRVAEKTCISMRRGQHIFPKFLFGKPADIMLKKIRWLPLRLRQMLAAFIIRLVQGRYAKHRLEKPDCKPFEIHPTINSELMYWIRHGRILTRRGISRIEGNTVHFTNGVSDDFDVLISATGYRINFPFFDKNLIDFSASSQIPLYLKMMHEKHENLYFIGLFQPQGCIWPLADFQAKLAAEIMAGKRRRPAKLAQKIQAEMKQSRARFRQSPRHALEVDYQAFRRQLLRALR